MAYKPSTSTAAQQWSDLRFQIFQGLRDHGSHMPKCSIETIVARCFHLLSFSSPKTWLERSRRIGNRQSFDDLVCPHKDLRRNSYANLSSCSEIDHELEFRRPLYRQVARLSAFKNSIHEVCEAAERG